LQAAWLRFAWSPPAFSSQQNHLDFGYVEWGSTSLSRAVRKCEALPGSGLLRYRPLDKRQLPLHHFRMIRRFGHRGLRRLYENDDRRGVSSKLVEKTARVLARLDVATQPEQLNLPGFRLHGLEGDLAGYWSVTVEGEWRIIFSFDVENTTDIDLVEYH
jgi:toxin HigB-1